MVDGLRERERLHDLFGRHVGTEVAHAALQGSGSLGGEQCDATALFVDIIGSTSLGERLAPTEVVELLNEYFAEVVAAVRAEGGWVNKFEGDSALCVFGPPVGHADHAARALRAAAAMRNGLLALKQRRPDVDAGIGVATGVVVAGNIGTDDRFEFTVIGDPVNTASRVSELAKSVGGRVLTTAATIDASGIDRSGWQPIEAVTLRGRNEATELYELR
jgi:adenylate cyclase